jgi:hypothetical protein
MVNQEEARMLEIEKQAQMCHLYAAQDGLVVYHVGEVPTRTAIVAVGENVKEGQKLVHVCDPKHMSVLARVHEAVIAQVRRGQQATVRVDAFPNRVVPARVQNVATVASARDWISADVKVYAVSLELLEDATPLKPGMSAEVRIEVGRKNDAVQLPVQTVLRSGPESFCYVKTAQEIQKRKVIPGLKSDVAVEIKSGVNEGEEVLRDPSGVIRRLRSVLIPPAPGKTSSLTPRTKAIHVRSVAPELPPGTRQKFTVSYGLTLKDLERISALAAPNEVIPLRRFAMDVWRGERRHPCQVVAGTPELADLFRLQTDTGRFLSPADLSDAKPVVVLGAGVARVLFPEDNALGSTLVVGKQAYSVVGVLHQHDGGPLDLENGVLLPLTTAQQRFGDRILIQQSGSRRLETVQLTDIFVTEPAQDAAAMIDGIRAFMERGHPREDWRIEPEGI